MEFTRELDITPEEFFDQIEKTILEDAERATGKPVTRKKLAGMRYTKRSKQGGKNGTTLDVKIRKYRYPEVYEVKFTYSSGVNTICYRAEPAGEGMILTYSEKFVNPRATGGWFERWRLARYEKRAEKRADQTLKSIVSYAKKDREARRKNPLLAELDTQDTDN